ncbi:MAG: J domain-containing protein [Clostridia bacterium]|nr:J domain-containing protein [Clostridia bacterium]
MAKQYADAVTYEAKLEKVMSRLSVEKYDYNWDRFSCWIEFWYKGQMYRFEHSIENAKAHGNNVRYGSDVFAQVVLTLEDIARMTERGIYELSTWVAGLKALPKPKNIPNCFLLLGFNYIPTFEDLKKRYKEIAKTNHPDVGGNAEYFISIQDAFESAQEVLKNGDSE